MKFKLLNEGKDRQRSTTNSTNKMFGAKAKKLHEAYYGGAFDIEADQYFTRDDLNEFAEDVVDCLNASSYDRFDFTEIYLEPGNILELTLVWSYYEETIKERIDMRKIRRPHDLIRVYSPLFVLRAKEAFSECGADFGPHLSDQDYPMDEALKEDVETPTLSGPVEGPESGLAALLNYAIQDELTTIQMYNDTAVTARAEGFEDIAAQIDEINTEENKHVGQLQELLKTISPNAQAIDAGELEAGDDLVAVNESVDSGLIQQLVSEYKELWTPDSSDTIFDEISKLHGKEVASAAIEELMKVHKSLRDESLNNSNKTPNNNSEDNKGAVIVGDKERWETIYNSFKTIEQELKGDGEAITATVTKLYNDNVSDPDYKKAYDKWASGE